MTYRFVAFRLVTYRFVAFRLATYRFAAYGSDTCQWWSTTVRYLGRTGEENFGPPHFLGEVALSTTVGYLGRAYSNIICLRQGWVELPTTVGDLGRAEQCIFWTLPKLGVTVTTVYRKKKEILLEYSFLMI